MEPKQMSVGSGGSDSTADFVDVAGRRERRPPARREALPSLAPRAVRPRGAGRPRADGERAGERPPTPAELRRMKKRATNRESARRMRALRKGEWATLLAEVDALRAENAVLTARLAAVECGLDAGGDAGLPPATPALTAPAGVGADLPDVPFDCGEDDAADLLAWTAVAESAAAKLEAAA